MSSYTLHKAPASLDIITPELWDKAWMTRRCLACGGRTEHESPGCLRYSYACNSCGLVVWHSYDLTQAGRGVADGFGWAGAPYPDGTYPVLRTNQQYGSYRREKAAEVPEGITPF